MGEEHLGLAHPRNSRKGVQLEWVVVSGTGEAGRLGKDKTVREQGTMADSGELMKDSVTAASTATVLGMWNEVERVVCSKGDRQRWTA